MLRRSGERPDIMHAKPSKRSKTEISKKEKKAFRGTHPSENESVNLLLNSQTKYEFRWITFPLFSNDWCDFAIVMHQQSLSPSFELLIYWFRHENPTILIDTVY